MSDLLMEMEYSVDCQGNCRGVSVPFRARSLINIANFTGKGAIYFAKRMKNSIFVVSNLVLMRLALITDNYVRKNL